MRLPHASTVISSAALFVALSGTGYAAVTIKANSVGSSQIRNHSITQRDIKPGSLTSSVIKDKTISAKDVAPSTLRALEGDPGAAGAAGTTGLPGMSLSVNTRSATGALRKSSSDPAIGPGQVTVTASCEAGEFAVGGGGTQDGARMTHVTPRASGPTADGTGWTVSFTSLDDQNDGIVTARVVCARLVPSA